MDQQKIENTFMKALDQVDTLSKAFEAGSAFEQAVEAIGGDIAWFEDVRKGLEGLWDTVEDAHRGALGHMDESMEAPRARHMTLAEAPFDGPRVGRKLQALAVKEPNDMIANAMANVADHLEDWGTPFGPRSMGDLVKKTGLTPEIIKMVIARANKVQEGAYGKKKKYNESSYLKGDLYDRAEAHEEQARYHEEEAAAAKKGGDKVEAMYHREAYQAHTKAAAYLDKHIAKRDQGMNTTVQSIHSQRAHEATEKANSFGESLEEAKLSPEQREELDDLIDMVKYGTSPSTYDPDAMDEAMKALKIIRSKFGDKVADQVADGIDTFHFPRHGMHPGTYGTDRLARKKPTQIKKDGKIDARSAKSTKRDIKSNLRDMGKKDPMKKAADDKEETKEGMDALIKSGNAKADAEAGERKKKTNEAKKPSAPKPRDPNSQYMNDLRKSGAMGAHKDKKKMDKIPRKAKHKGKAFEAVENPELDNLFEEIKLELKLRGM